MTKKVKISFLILVWSIVVLQMYVNYQERMKKDDMVHTDQVVTAFAASDKNIAESAITGQGYFGDMEITQKVKREMLTNLAWKLGVTEGYSFRENVTQDVTQLILTGETERYATSLHVVSKEEQGVIRQYIIVELVIFSEEEDVYEWYARIEKLFEEIGVKGEVHMEMSMEKDGTRWKTEKG